MGRSKGRKRKSENTVPCECGCGQLIYQFGMDGRERRFAPGHQFKGNQYGKRTYDLANILAMAAACTPFCACGCGEKLEVPEFLKVKGRGLQSIKSHWKRHPYKQGHGIWEKRTQHFVAKSGELSVELQGLIYGTVLGDGSISYPNSHSRFPRLAWTHGESQLHWLEHKAAKLAVLRPRIRITSNGGYGDRSACCSTACHPQLKAIYTVVKPDGCKQVNPVWLKAISPEGRAWWYMDDGSLSLNATGTPSIQMHTEGFSEPENQLIACWLCELGYAASVKSYIRASRQKRYFYIKLGAAAARKWIADHRCFAPEAMAYKFRDC